MFPVTYEMNLYTLFGRNLVFNRLTEDSLCCKWTTCATGLQVVLVVGLHIHHLLRLFTSIEWYKCELSYLASLNQLRPIT